ncbi:Fe-S cluster biogenesis protein NfuA [Bradyrhizobium sp. USDA 4461]
MPTESEQLRQLPAAMSGRELPIRGVIEDFRPTPQRGGDSRLNRIDHSRIVVSRGACAFCKLSREALDDIQAWLVNRICEFVRLIPVAAVAKA